MELCYFEFSFSGMSTNTTNSSEVSSATPVINWAMIRANKESNERMKFEGSYIALYIHNCS